MYDIQVFDLNSPNNQRDLERITFSNDIDTDFSSIKIGNRGYEVIDNKFFVEETIKYKNTYGRKVERERYIEFENFSDYFNYLNGDIYRKSCYYQASDSLFTNPKIQIDLKKIRRKKSFINYSYEDLDFSKENEDFEGDYQSGEKCKAEICNWINQFNACKDYSTFHNLYKEYRNSELAEILNPEIILFQYILADVSDTTRFDIMMQFLSDEPWPNYHLTDSIYYIYDPELIINSIDFSKWDRNSRSKYITRINSYIESNCKDKLSFYKGYYDSSTHFYFAIESARFTSIYRIFDSYEKFAEYLNNDFSNCDLTDVSDVQIDIESIKTNQRTRLPSNVYNKCNLFLEKSYKDGLFSVDYIWKNKNGNIIGRESINFKHFCDFIVFLNKDLSGADLIKCDGLCNLTDISEFDFTNAHVKSAFLKKHNLTNNTRLSSSYLTLCKSFDVSLNNEAPSNDILAFQRQEKLSEDEEWNSLRIHYVSDIHLLHRIKNAHCESEDDILYIIRNCVSNIVSELDSSFLLIGGDISSNYEIFSLFISELRNELDIHREFCRVFFVLGNHEFWDNNTESIDEIISKYRLLIESKNMYLLHNDIYYSNYLDGFLLSEDQFLTESDINSLSSEELHNKLRDAAIMILGGVGFSGLNKSFNATNGIYRDAISREQEINESKRFEKIYKKICSSVYLKHLIVFTHMPKNDWCEDDYINGVIYLSGHTHKNYFYDDKEYRIYADNQQGYSIESTHLKELYLYQPYDYFYDYKDGIYTITTQEYKKFCRVRNIRLTFNRKVYKLLMLKKNGYYCFIAQNKEGGLNILNGGAASHLACKDVQYYYDRMDEMISQIRKPLTKYTKFQNSISDAIKAFGGSGTCHGCIVDIDYFNHIYVNPVDGTITYYWASDIINKYIYSSLPELLESKCPELFDNYKKLIGTKSGSKTIEYFKKHELSNSVVHYLDTDIYKTSRQVKKFQKLDSNILTFWVEKSNNGTKSLSSKKSNH